MDEGEGRKMLCRLEMEGLGMDENTVFKCANVLALHIDAHMDRRLGVST